MTDVADTIRAHSFVYQDEDPLRDPDAELFTAGEDTSDRVKRLAKEVLGKRTRGRVAA